MKSSSPSDLTFLDSVEFAEAIKLEVESYRNNPVHAQQCYKFFLESGVEAEKVANLQGSVGSGQIEAASGILKDIIVTNQGQPGMRQAAQYIMNHHEVDVRKITPASPDFEFLNAQEFRYALKSEVRGFANDSDRAKDCYKFLGGKAAVNGDKVKEFAGYIESKNIDAASNCLLGIFAENQNKDMKGFAKLITDNATTINQDDVEKMGGSRKRLDDILKDHTEYQERLETLERSINHLKTNKSATINDVKGVYEELVSITKELIKIPGVKEIAEELKKLSFVRETETATQDQTAHEQPDTVRDARIDRPDVVRAENPLTTETTQLDSDEEHDPNKALEAAKKKKLEEDQLHQPSPSYPYPSHNSSSSDLNSGDIAMIFAKFGTAMGMAMLGGPAGLLLAGLFLLSTRHIGNVKTVRNISDQEQVQNPDLEAAAFHRAIQYMQSQEVSQSHESSIQADKSRTLDDLHQQSHQELTDTQDELKSIQARLRQPNPRSKATDERVRAIQKQRGYQPDGSIIDPNPSHSNDGASR